MVEVDIPFMDEFEGDMLIGKKVCTSRTEQYGGNRDTFKKFNAVFEIVCVVKFPLSVVAEYLYREEGCFSSANFKNVWIKLHPKNGYVPDWIVYVHFFTRLE